MVAKPSSKAEAGKASLTERAKAPARDADKERRYRKGRQLGPQRVHADDFSCDIHVTDRHPFAPPSFFSEIANALLRLSENRGIFAHPRG